MHVVPLCEEKKQTKNNVEIQLKHQQQQQQQTAQLSKQQQMQSTLYTGQIAP